MNRSSICQHCGAKMVEYKFSFNKGMAQFLLKLYDAQGPAKTDELGLTYSQRTNSQKLRYWGLAEPVTDTAEQRKKSGWWKITAAGYLFVNGEISIQKFAVMYRNVFRRYEGGEIYFKDVYEGYQNRAEFKEQARAQLAKVSFDAHGQGDFLLNK